MPPLVSIACITYNHEQYVRQCLDGFIMQKTNFAYEIVIHDDASEDKTQDVILEYCRKYPNLFRPILQKENKYKEGKGILARFVFPECRGKYIALCEGDDYWIDPFKLQKQVNVLESDADCTLVISNGEVQNTITGLCKRINPLGNCSSGYVNIHDLLKEKYYLIPTASMLFRKEYYAMPQLFYDAPVGDKSLRMWCAINGKVYYFNDLMVLYRFNTQNSFGKRITCDKNLAKRVYQNMISFYDRFNVYTEYMYNSDIIYLKEKEEYFFLIRTGQREKVIECSYFQRMPFLVRIKYKFKTILQRLYNDYLG